MTYSTLAPTTPPEHILGVVRHLPTTAGSPPAAPWPSVAVRSAADHDQAFHEVWTSSRTAFGGQYKNLSYRHDGETFFCAAEIPDAARLRNAVRATYQAVVELTRRLGYRLLRVWNHVGNINAGNADGLERYRDFCQGRAEALEDLTGEWRVHLPAASCVGALAGGAVLYCLATRSRRPLHFENPHQVPAYHYPPKYGPRSPSFARATLLPGDTGPAGGQLFVSGTASVVGHATTHPDDVAEQCDTTEENLEHLLKHVGQQTGTSPGLPDFRFAKIYVRQAPDIPYVAGKFRSAFGENTEIRVLNVDLCRSDLLLEVEGVVAMA
ncbi:FkbO/Hyg5 family chorismatase [Saccharopolyspora hattusasensis]|uniref:FkbO/Hyg5 family chorismatase n=1 Tax=Saccharopolyspora hattusasensis TaxID=1128679 RepID=UPI003D95EFCB